MINKIVLLTFKFMRMDMKRLLLLFVLCFSVSGLMAQGYLPIFENGKVWDYEWVPYNTAISPFPGTYYVNGDTLINNKTCFKLFAKEDDGYTRFVGVFYETEGKVFTVREEDSAELLIYDFTVKKGDVVNVYNYEERTFSDVLIRDVQTLNLQGRNVKCVYYECSGFYTQGWWLEGVGSDSGFEFNIGKNTPGYGFALKSCYLGDKHLFSVDVDNPTGIGEIIRDANGLSSEDNAVYDLSGRRLNEKPTKGLYVQGGKVYMAR